MALLVGFAACEQEPEGGNEQTEHVVVLNIDKETIKADGTDIATFEVTVDGTVRTAECQIICLNDNSTIEDGKFSTTKAGTYEFKAAFGDVLSETKSIVATAVEQEPETNVVLSVDKSEIQANDSDMATFTITVDGTAVTEGYVIKNLNYNIDLEGNTFTSDVAGNFRFVAEYDGKKSNEVEVKAIAVEVPVAKELVLVATPSRIKANGTDEAVFTVTYGDEDVTANAEIYNTADNSLIESKKFTSTQPGTYNFRARYNDVSTGVSTSVTVYDPNWEGKYEPGMLYNENGVKGVIFTIHEHQSSGTMYCYIMSMDEEDLAWSTEQVDLQYASGTIWGAWITEDIFSEQRDNRDINDYPAFKFCVDHGEGWFLPSQEEMTWMWDAVSGGTHDFNSPTVAEFNKTLTENGGEPLVETFYWSSTGLDKSSAVAVAFMKNSVVCLESTRDKKYSVRAAYRFAIN